MMQIHYTTLTHHLVQGAWVFVYLTTAIHSCMLDKGHAHKIQIRIITWQSVWEEEMLKDGWELGAQPGMEVLKY